MKLLTRFLVVLTTAVAFLTASAGPVIKKAIQGTPNIKAIDVLSFAPGGVLLIGDGRSQQIVAVDTGDTTRLPGAWKELKGFAGELAARLGAEVKGVEIIDMAVNPASGALYVAARKQNDKSYLVAIVVPGGEIGHFPLENVKHAVVSLPKGEKSPVSKITDLAWAGNRLVAAARCNEAFASKIFSTSGALEHGKAGQLFSAETYHISHRKWETKAPMSVLIPFEEDGQHYIVGAFSCTPVVKYPIDDLQPGAKIKGISMIELGSGNRPLDMFAYSKGGKASVLANTFRFHHSRKPFGPSPYWATRFDQDLLAGEKKINKDAVRRLGGGYKPITDRIEMVEAYHGVVQMDRLNNSTAIALRKAGDDFDLVPLPLP